MNTSLNNYKFLIFLILGDFCFMQFVGIKPDNLTQAFYFWCFFIPFFYLEDFKGSICAVNMLWKL